MLPKLPRLHLTIILLAWFSLYAWRPWYFGLYHDDWILLLPLDLPGIADAFKHMPTRPVLVALNVLGGNLIGTNPFAWQALMAVFMLLATLSLARFAIQFVTAAEIDKSTVSLSATATACCWLAFPWTLGFTAFASTFTGLLGLILFFRIGEIIFSTTIGRRELIWASLISIILGLMFESLWGAPVLLALIRWALEFVNTRRIQNLATSMLVALSGVQLLHLAYNRFWAWLGAGQNKAFSTDSLNLAASSLANLYKLLAATLSAHPALLATAGLFSLLTIVAFLRLKTSGKIHILILIAISSAGLLTSLIVYAFGGYVVETNGLFSRTTFGFSVWIAISSAWLVALAARKSMLARRLTAVCMLCIFGYLAVFQINNTTAWRHSWTFQQQVLEAFPLQSFLSQAVPTGTLLIEAPPPEPTNVYGLHAFWDISGALYSRFPEIRTIFHKPTTSSPLWSIATMANEQKLRSDWNGEILTQRWCDSSAELWNITAPGGLLYWRMGDIEVTPIHSPSFSKGC